MSIMKILDFFLFYFAKYCDFSVKIPMKGKIQSLNAAVSTGIIVYEAVKQRIKQ